MALGGESITETETRESVGESTPDAFACTVMRARAAETSSLQMRPRRSAKASDTRRAGDVKCHSAKRQCAPDDSYNERNPSSAHIIMHRISKQALVP
jgi:hypothetical protein